MGCGDLLAMRTTLGSLATSPVPTTSSTPTAGYVPTSMCTPLADSGLVEFLDGPLEAARDDAFPTSFARRSGRRAMSPPAQIRPGST